MVEVGRKREGIIAEQRGVEREVAFHGERLAQYKREVGNCQTAAREHQEEADTLIREAGEMMIEELGGWRSWQLVSAAGNPGYMYLTIVCFRLE